MNPHRRFNPLTGEWVLVSPHRTSRPWLGAQESSPESRPPYDSGCYLCPGNVRTSGQRNPDYTGTFVFPNDFPALLGVGEAGIDDGIFRAEPVRGECRVLCFSPRHDLTLAEMSLPEIEAVVTLWHDQIAELERTWRCVQIFENKGEAMGCSNPHPHGQVWATDIVPTLIEREESAQASWLARTEMPLLAEVAARESEGPRCVARTRDWLAIVPFWAVWPFETLIVPLRPVSRFAQLAESQQTDLAVLLKDLLGRYDRLFDTSFPYSMGWHGAPVGSDHEQAWIVHAHIYPPLLRSATVRKFMVGYELLAESQRDLTPEEAAERLRQV